ncbi:hypothetical protein CROQUDRAFT_666043 [Cronartium quercuum f. sp. fusiforme G11]|uniref:Uncharacterized protein n=1 Tax=Cronartium quercuum f. sp. fusiforme G11 TaxID=708437 RepID=A0A9P6N5M1_9BASI|nr:hypothetical protein CROQUDRAFT_666043 [Cronartium quercuum f. sp. fusiforme G11]
MMSTKTRLATAFISALSIILRSAISPGLVNQIQIGPQNQIDLIPIKTYNNASFELPSPFRGLRPNAMNVTALAELLSLALLPYTEDNTIHSESVSDKGPVVDDPDSVSGTSMATGTSMQTGKIKDGSGLMWQSSGTLTKGGCPKTVLIKNCYTLKLSEDPSKNLDPGGRTPRQRIEFLTPGYADGSSATFTWNSYLDSTVTSTPKFFHLVQLYSRGEDGPVMSLDAKNQYASILDPLRCPSDCGDGTSMDLEAFKGRTISHALKVTFGPLGRMDYVLGDMATRQVELGYSMHGGSVGSQSTSLKFGTYRSAMNGMGSSLAYVGDFRSHT